MSILSSSDLQRAGGADGGSGWHTVQVDTLDARAFTRCTFRRVRFVGGAIRAKFSESTFDDCVVENVQSCGTLFGAENRWIDCSFSRVSVDNPLTPKCSFSRCQFDQVRLLGAKVWNVAFSDCVFSDLELDGFRVMAGARAAFLRCQFHRSSFANADFAGVTFSQCSVTGLSVVGTSFVGVDGVPCWWAGYVSGDPFLEFLTAVDELIRRSVGEGSALFRAFARYRGSYLGGNTVNRDYSACFFGDDVPPEEYEAIEYELGRLEHRFAL